MTRGARKLTWPGWVPGLVAVVLIWGGRMVLDRVLPGGARGAEVGWAVFVMLTGLAVERAEGRWGWRFWRWVMGGVVLGGAVGVILQGLGGG